MTGLSVEILKYVCDKINLTAVFLSQSLNLDVDSCVKQFVDLNQGLSDVKTGIFPLFPPVATSSFDSTIPYIPLNVKMLVPCPKAIPGTEKVLTIFSLSG
jgi:hypothetical protein